ncbi:MAG: alpha/beta hydrolase [Lentimicrobiaceae bacterium]|jgi:pimeloyl-ACP methyl ester carboxylesterase|nr:alpha/beta hydrolase [Lentimicrobiaceae bacterium]
MVELFFREYGVKNQPVILILHGLLGISDNWIPFAKQFVENGFYVVIPDLRNHGRSPHNDVFNFEVMAADVWNLIENQKLELPILLGHSMGGKLAALMALEKPEKISKLILADTALSPFKKLYQHLDLIRIMQQLDLSKYNSISEIEKTLSEQLDTKKMRNFLLKNLYRTKEKTFAWRSNLEQLKENILRLNAPKEPTNGYEKPTLCLRSETSGFVEQSDFDFLKQFFPNVTLKTIENASHWLHVDQPEAFMTSCLEFLRLS